ncbi:hypothetical protein [Limnofasciculus baicalensis]|uniref:hypothetical protein n=1 Tax=Limnofasciculus baicalensis TaxID=3064906 RepID=UPI0020A73EF5|nr:hypothetical protein [Limnofasciculus baicalensis]
MSKIEPLLLVVVILLQIVLIVLFLQRQPRLVPEGAVVRGEPEFSKETREIGEVRAENLWENPLPASEEMKSTVAEFKTQYNRIRRQKIIVASLINYCKEYIICLIYLVK